MDVERKSTSTSAPRAVTGISDRHWPVKETQLNGLTLARLDTDVTVKFPSACGGAEEEEQNGNKKKREKEGGGGGEGMRFHFTIHQPHLDFFFLSQVYLTLRMFSPFNPWAVYSKHPHFGQFLLLLLYRRIQHLPQLSF